jgi:hypothetical protein
MKIMIIGSAGYLEDIEEHRKKLEREGHAVRRAAYDDLNANEYQICAFNKAGIKWADVVHVFWDSRSIGTQFDIGMAFALDKPIQIMRLNPKTLRNFVLQLHGASRDGAFGPIWKEEGDEAGS